MEGIIGADLVRNTEVLQKVKWDTNLIQVLMLYSGQLCAGVHCCGNVYWGFPCSGRLFDKVGSYGKERAYSVRLVVEFRVTESPSV
jgi:hypothetical protein